MDSTRRRCGSRTTTTRKLSRSSFRDLIELRFVKALRDMSLSLPTIRQCFELAVQEVKDARPFSTNRFRTDGKTIFLEKIIPGVQQEGELVDLKRGQSVFHRFVEGRGVFAALLVK
jgi:hypothetical protein